MRSYFLTTTTLCPTPFPAAPASPKSPPVIDGPPGENEAELQKMLFVGNYAGAVDAAIEVHRLLSQKWLAPGRGLAAGCTAVAGVSVLCNVPAGKLTTTMALGSAN